MDSPPGSPSDDASSSKENSPNSNFDFSRPSRALSPHTIYKSSVVSSTEFVVQAEDIFKSDSARLLKSSQIRSERKFSSTHRTRESKLSQTTVSSRNAKSSSVSNSSALTDGLTRLKLPTTTVPNLPDRKYANSTSRKLSDVRKPVPKGTTTTANSLRRVSGNVSSTLQTGRAIVRPLKISEQSQEKKRSAVVVSSHSKLQIEQGNLRVSMTATKKASASTESSNGAIGKLRNSYGGQLNSSESDGDGHRSSSSDENARSLSMVLRSEQQLAQQLDQHVLQIRQLESQLTEKDFELDRFRMGGVVLKDLVSSQNREIMSMKAKSQELLNENTALRDLSRNLEKELLETREVLKFARERQEMEITSCEEQIACILNQLDTMSTDLVQSKERKGAGHGNSHACKSEDYEAQIELKLNLGASNEGNDKPSEVLESLCNYIEREEATWRERCSQIVHDIGSTALSLLPPEDRIQIC